MKRLLLIDRDGTLIVEPPIDFQVDSLAKLEFYPKVISNLGKIARELPYELLMVTNQDGLGTESFPEENFWPAHHKMLTTFANEGIAFRDVLIDRSFPHENSPTRKPRTGLLTPYLKVGEYDFSRSFVIGDRLTDMELAYNLGARGILIHNPIHDFTFSNPAIENVIELITTDWEEVYQFLALEEQAHSRQYRNASIVRKTNETQIQIDLELDGQAKYEINTGLDFLDHLVEQFAKHSRINLKINAEGDLHIDEHHTVEDVAITLGEAFTKALGSKRGIERYGFFILPMDEAKAEVAIDFSGRSYLVWDVLFARERVGDVPTELFEHFFKSFSDNSKATLHIKAEGKNAHHIIEAVFKAFAKACKLAFQRTEYNDLPSTKGVL
jgi:imidazoleglycerol-phosphate dehydratase/histidinol-phosphatase